MIQAQNTLAQRILFPSGTGEVTVDSRGRRQIGVAHKLYFKLDHFTGCHFGLFVYSTKEIGGSAAFTDFVYKEQ